MLQCASLTPAPAFCGWKGAKRCQMLCIDIRPLWMKGTVLGRRGRWAVLRRRGGRESLASWRHAGLVGIGEGTLLGLISGSASLGRHFPRDLSERRETFSGDQLSDPDYPPPAHHLHRPLFFGAGVERRRQHPVMAGASLQPGERPGGYG